MMRHSFDYYTPDEYYEVVVSKLVSSDSSWIDVGGGKDLFPDNPALATELAARCRWLVAVDPSDTVEGNQFAKQRVKKRIEEFTSSETFDFSYPSDGCRAHRSTRVMCRIVEKADQTERQSSGIHD